jgi:hypothetical protein
MKGTYYLIASLALLPATPALAVEGALGRPISGAGINPYAGVVPPAPGWILGVSELYYDGDIGGGVATPVGANLTLDLDLKASFTPVTLTYIWDTHNPCWNFASAIALPIVWIEAEADVSVGPLTGRRKEDEFGLFDITLVPIVASYHISKTEHLSFGLTVWAPTGKYDSDDLANLGLNKWTFIPTVGYTKIFAEPNIELSASLGVHFSTENDETDYEDGILTDLEFTVIKRFHNGFGIGMIGSWIDQWADDEGGAADALNGFRGKAFGVGPIFTYSTKIGDSSLDLNARWVHEFENEKRLEGNLFALSASYKF